eukprot:607807-Pelagomonas_calceolata.AAC.3
MGGGAGPKDNCRRNAAHAIVQLDGGSHVYKQASAPISCFGKRDRDAVSCCLTTKAVRAEVVHNSSWHA